jgi:hypothetical protein
VLLLFTFIGIVVGTLILDPKMIRLLLFMAIFIGLIAISQRWPVVVLFAVTIYLPFMGLLRRFLIPFAGWNSFDPLVLLPPAIIAFMTFAWVYKHYIRREPILDDTKLFRMVRWMIFIQAIQIANPLQGGIFVGVGGLLFHMIPLFWFFLGRTYMDEKYMKRMIATVFAIGCFSAIYGLKQIMVGFFSFEYKWVAVGGYASLMLGPDVIRAFSIFTNAGEYALYLVITIVIAWVFVLKGNFMQRIISLGLLPILWYALFMESSRTSVIMTLLASALITIVQAKPGKARLMITGLTAVFVGVIYLGMTSLAHNDNPILSHKINGLANPMDSEDSTASLHLTMVIEGIKEGFTFPIGRGLGITTIAGGKIDSHVMNTEYDLSNMFVSLGLVGGMLYFFIYVKVFRLSYSMTKSGSKLSLILYGTLVGSAGLWLMGGNYSTVAWIWILIGYLDIAAKRSCSQLNGEIEVNPVIMPIVT